tara:strand:+ start:137 stop:628 length:492 start_codon:yes stop_codon:yes gene_type:complete
MIITCPSCKKKFEIDAALIPSEGRNLKCGSCDQIWFYKKDNNNHNEIREPESLKERVISDEILKNEINPNKSNKTNLKSSNEKKLIDNENKSSEIVEYTPKSNFIFLRFLSYMLVTIISFIALIVILDTFKVQLYDYLPNLEFFLFSLYETLKDIQLFIKDLV